MCLYQSLCTTVVHNAAQNSFDTVIYTNIFGYTLSFSSSACCGGEPVYIKERKSIYIAPFLLCMVSKRSDMHHTVLPLNYTMPAFPS